MIITVASGKGGTGKTTVATNLAIALMGGQASPLIEGRKLVFADCDVEAPNAAVFLRPALRREEQVTQLVPLVDADACTACGRCSEVCQYHAIVQVGEQVLVFADLCHGCGSCTLECPVNAISETPYVMGTIEQGRVGSMSYIQGTLLVGEPLAPPVVRRVRHLAQEMGGPDGIVIVDAPPGTSTSVLEALRGSDYALLVTEPTPFGLHDLRMAVVVARQELGLPVGVVVNRDGLGDSGVDDYCRQQGIPILMRIPLDRRIAESHLAGRTMVAKLPGYREQFLYLFHRIAEEVSP